MSLIEVLLALLRPTVQFAHWDPMKTATSESSQSCGCGTTLTGLEHWLLYIAIYFLICTFFLFSSFFSLRLLISVHVFTQVIEFWSYHHSHTVPWHTRDLNFCFSKGQECLWQDWYICFIRFYPFDLLLLFNSVQMERHHSHIAKYWRNFAWDSTQRLCVRLKGHYLDLLLKCSSLRIPDSYGAKIAKIYNFWTSWPVFQLVRHLVKILQNKIFFRQILKRWLISWNTGQDVQKLQIFAIFAS